MTTAQMWKLHYGDQVYHLPTGKMGVYQGKHSSGRLHFVIIDGQIKKLPMHELRPATIRP